jgi:tryptophan synthase alpha chain
VNRIDQRFDHLRQQRRKGLIVYIGAGDPNPATTLNLCLAFEAAGADIVELGIPFSDPLADGPVNQLAAQRGLASGTTPTRVLEIVAQIRQSSALPIVLYLYYNLVHRRGLHRFVQDARDAGVDGLLVLDLPPEESAAYDQTMLAANLAPIYLLAPTTPQSRVQTIVSHGRGFIYYVSREGVTGMQSQIASSLPNRIALIRQSTPLPIAVGFGISTPDQAAEVAQLADAVVVGSAVVDCIARAQHHPDLVPSTAQFVRKLALAVHSL